MSTRDKVWLLVHQCSSDLSDVIPFATEALAVRAARRLANLELRAFWGEIYSTVVGRYLHDGWNGSVSISVVGPLQVQTSLRGIRAGFTSPDYHRWIYAKK